MPIRKLSQHLVNKIAAGEVIARPASVIKEAVENSLDAGATRIDVAVEEGGKKLLRITDDGCGIPFDELPLAFESHATSKLVDDADLFRIGTLGFRGEALASIASVAQVSLLSRPTGADSGGRIEAENGTIGAPQPAAAAPGTCFEVRNLFFNTPARRKFLKADSTEMGHITDAVTKLALAHPAVQFTLTHNGRESLSLPGGQTLRARIGALFSKEVSEALIEINRAENGVNLNGFVAPLNQSRANSRMQFFYLNGRHIRDKVITHALNHAFDGVVMPGQYPVAFLFMDMNPAEVDVNVHPTKSEVRFRASGVIHNILVHAIRQAVSGEAHPTKMHLQNARGFQSFATDAGPANPQSLQQALSAYLGGQRPGQQRGFDQAAFLPPARPIGSGDGIDDLSDQPFRPPVSVEQGLVAANAETVGYVQLFNTYILEETPEGVCLTDQHALHERILYEEILNRVQERPLESQKLLIPETVHLETEAQAVGLAARAELFSEFGMEVEHFGGKTLALYAVPKMIKRFYPQDLFQQLALDLENENNAAAAEEARNHVIATMACKAAVKAGDRLTQEEMRYLIENKQMAFLRHSCPHGRPTTLFLSLTDIERQFKRIV